MGSVNARFLLRERAKAGLRGALGRLDLGLVRGPFDRQVVRAASWLELREVLDVGANIGQYASALFTAGFAGRIVSCEPLSEASAELGRRAARNPRWEAVRTAVGAAEGTLEINVSANSYSSSVLAVNETHLAADATSRVVATETVPVTTVDALVDQHRLDPAAALLKIDTQGYESDVLDGAKATLSRFAAVQLEMSFVPLYEGQALFDELNRRVTAEGFVLFTMSPGLSDAHTGRLLQSDVLYVAADRMPPAR
jgi:FkbM family methyltransferase